MAVKLSDGTIAVIIASPKEIADKIQSELEIAIPGSDTGKIGKIDSAGQLAGIDIDTVLTDSANIPTSSAVMKGIQDLLDDEIDGKFLTKSEEVDAGKWIAKKDDGYLVLDTDDFTDSNSNVPSSKLVGEAFDTKLDLQETVNTVYGVDESGEQKMYALSELQTEIEGSEFITATKASTATKTTVTIAAAGLATKAELEAEETTRAAADTALEEKIEVVEEIPTVKHDGTTAIDDVLINVTDVDPLTQKTYVDETIDYKLRELKALRFAGFIGNEEPDTDQTTKGDIWIKTKDPIEGLPTKDDFDDAEYFIWDGSAWQVDDEKVFQNMEGYVLTDEQTGEAAGNSVYYFGGTFNWLDFNVDFSNYVKVPIHQALETRVNNLPYVKDVKVVREGVPPNVLKIDVVTNGASETKTIITVTAGVAIDWNSNGLVAG